MIKRALLLLLVVATPLFAGEPKGLEEARAAYQQIAQPTETDRVKYVESLVNLHQRLLDAKQLNDVAAVNLEIGKYPMPKTADDALLRKLLAGKWRSPRHDYLVKPDGAWIMLPMESDATHGTWSIKGNKFIESGTPYTILLLTAKDFVFTDGSVVFYRWRLKK